MSIVSKGIQTFRFSRREPKNIWDDERWGEELSTDCVPDASRTKELGEFIRFTSEDLSAINGVLRQLRIYHC